MEGSGVHDIAVTEEKVVALLTIRHKLLTCKVGAFQILSSSPALISDISSEFHTIHKEKTRLAEWEREREREIDVERFHFALHCGGPCKTSHTLGHRPRRLDRRPVVRADVRGRPGHARGAREGLGHGQQPGENKEYERH